MQTSARQSLVALADMHARSVMATAEFYQKIGREAPPPPPRYRAEAKGKGWHIIEVSTGKTRGFRFSHSAAMRCIDEMEAGAASKRGLQ